jgi:hypothetical protein
MFERLSIRSFLKAIRWISLGNFFEKILLNIFSVSLHLNDWIIIYKITTITHNVKRYIRKVQHHIFFLHYLNVATQLQAPVNPFTARQDTGSTPAASTTNFLQ